MTFPSIITQLTEKIEKISKNNSLNSNPPVLLAACKAQPASVIEKAIEAGITDFGENRVQEAEDKWPALKKAYPGVRLHLIGPLQTNKVKQALELFDVIQTVDRMKLADEIAKEIYTRSADCASLEPASCERQQARSGGKQFYIQVNTGKEPQKAGVLPNDADALIRHCKENLKLPIAGLMCVPPHDQPPAPHFAYLKKLARDYDFKELSMGMSDDFETAIRMGSTCVRLGRILFGERSA